MSAGEIILQGVGKEGTLYAAVDPNARYCSSDVATMRFAALLTPFQTETAARAALIDAGAANVCERPRSAKG